MSGLTPEGEELVRAGRAAFRPSDADRERVFQALLPKLGGGPTSPTDAPPGAATVVKASLVKAGAVLVGLGVAGAGLFLALRQEPSPTPRTSAVASAAPVAASPAPVDENRQRVVPVTPETPSVEKRAPSPSRSADNLAQEVAILSRAGAELHAGRPKAALLALDEHQRRFPGGALTQERTAARVQALCALGRTKEARTEFARLARMSPGSPYEARARKACGSVLSGEK